MLLAVNIGNTNIRVAIGKSGSFSETAVIPINYVSENTHFIQFIKENYGNGIWKKIEGSIICSVVQDMTHVISKAILNETGIIPQRIDVSNCGNLKIIRYDGNLGEDRAVCCAGALFKYKPPFVLIDFGTATTINVINEKNKFLGGAILTGVQMGLKSLSDNTSRLPEIDADTNVLINTRSSVIGKGTSEGLISGAVIGAACAVEGFIRKIEYELNCKISVVVTGGHAPLVLPYCDFNYSHEPNLLLEGLFALYKSKNPIINIGDINNYETI